MAIKPFKGKVGLKKEGQPLSADGVGGRFPDPSPENAGRADSNVVVRRYPKLRDKLGFKKEGKTYLLMEGFTRGEQETWQEVDEEIERIGEELGVDTVRGPAHKPGDTNRYTLCVEKDDVPDFVRILNLGK